MRRTLRHSLRWVAFLGIGLAVSPCLGQFTAHPEFRPVCVAFGNGRFVAAGEDRIILVSEDGKNWLRKSSGLPTGSFGINFDTEVYTRNGDSVTLVNPVGMPRQSELPTRISYEFRAIGFGGGKFVLLGERGELFVSADGERWETGTVGTAADLYAVTWGGGKFVAVGAQGTILASRDGIHWAPQPSGTDQTLYDIAYGNGRFIAVGDDGVVLVSTNGERWNLAGENFRRHIGSVAFGKDRFLASTRDENPLMLISADGMQWKEKNKPSSGVVSLTHGDRGFVAVNQSGQPCVSENGEVWLPPFPQRGHVMGFRRATFGNGVYVVVGKQILARSTDGANWEHTPPPTSRLMCGSITWGRIFNALSGRSASTIRDPSDFMGSAGRRLRTGDGVHWQTLDGAPTPGNVDGNRIVYPKPRKGYEFAVLASEDGINWTRLNTLPPQSRTTLVTNLATMTILHEGASSAGVVINLNGKIYRLTMPAKSGDIYELQASTNLEQWATLAVLTNQAQGLNFMDQDATNYAQRFYRLKAVR